MKTFKDLQFIPHPLSSSEYDHGIQARLLFDNGYSVSVVKGPHTYGGKDGLYELAVFKDGEIHYDNSVANGDVRGYLTEQEVSELITEVENFTK